MVLLGRGLSWAVKYGLLQSLWDIGSMVTGIRVDVTVSLDSVEHFWMEILEAVTVGIDV